MIDPEQVMELFAAASELPPGERAAFLQRECDGREELMAQLEALLASEARADAAGFLREPAIHEVARQTAPESIPNQRSGELFGRYRIVRRIGEGGMGEVYLAEDTELARKVALKLIRNALRTDDLLDRFSREGQILAHLNHESIAGLLDAGTSAGGIPFLVMEYVDGIPITEHCDRSGLSVSARLELFRTVCAAVQYAHQNVIVHRDLKPSNILVTAEGQVKLLDFGIAKLLDSPLSSDAPPTLIPALTPEYASPEQVKGEATTTATDVYSLGVVLYELLTGAHLFVLKRRTTHEMFRAICESEPRLPSVAAGDKLRRRLRGDLDHIVMKALRKEPQARYPTVEQFSDDITRHLEGLPVIARRRTFRYRAAKFVGRNRVAVIAAAIVLLTLVSGIVATTWEARVAIAQRITAQKRFEEAQKLAHTVLFDYHDAIAALPGSTLVRKRLVTDALIYLNGISQESLGDLALQLEVATAYLRVGDVQGRPYAANLGQTDAALASYRKAQAILEPIVAKDGENHLARRQLANTYERLGAIELRRREYPESLADQRRALLIREELLTHHPTDSGVRRELGVSHLYSGDAQQALCFGGPALLECLNGALESQRRALEIFQELSRAHPDDLQLRRDIAEAYMKIGFRLRDISSSSQDKSILGQALDSEQSAMRIREEVATADPANARDRRSVADQRMLLSDAQAAVGDLAAAIAGYRKSAAAFQALSAADPVNAEAQRDLGNVHFKLAKALVQAGKPVSALDSYSASLSFVKQLVAEDPTNAEDRQLLSGIYLLSSVAAETAGDFPRAVALYTSFFTGTSPRDRSMTFTGTDGVTLYHLGHLNVLAAKAPAIPAIQRAKYWEAAREALRRSIDILREEGAQNGYLKLATQDLALSESR